MRENIILFDMDDTIIKGDSILKFMLFFIQKKPQKIFSYIALIPYFILFLLKIIKNQKIKERIATIFKDIEVDELSEIGLQFANSIIPQLYFNDALETIKKHKENKEYLVLITASFSFYAEHVANNLGFDLCLGSDLWRLENKYTGYLYGKNCYKKEKQYRLYVEGIRSAKSAYSDSISDLPLFEFAENKICVNPKQNLKKYAEKNSEYGFSIVNWS